MESLSCSSYLMPTIGVSHGVAWSGKFPVTPSLVRGWGARVRPHRFFFYSKKSSFPDFQYYAKPRRLLPATGPELFVDASLEKIISSLQLDGSQCLYKVLLHTSSIYGSGLSDLNAGILVCVIDENDDSILERIPTILHKEDIIHFQKGSTDEFIFVGPKLGRIEAMWVSLESGTWRLAGTNLTIFSACNYQAEQSSKDESRYHSISYNFEVEDVLLGEGGEMSMVELRPCSVTEYAGADSFVAVDAREKPLARKGTTKEDGMKEYAKLKYSLLLYDAMLVFAGTSISSFTAGEDTALAFLTGGITGFLYLLLLQRSVDRLSVPELVSVNKGSNLYRLFGLRGPLLVLAFALGVGVLVVKREVPGIEAALTPKEVVVGMMGFLACKVSVVLAAFKPISIGMEDSN